MDIDKFIIRLNLIKEQRNFNDKELGELFEVSDVVISNYRRKLTHPKRYNLDKYSSALGLNYDWVIGDVDEPMYVDKKTTTNEPDVEYQKIPTRKVQFQSLSAQAYDILFEEMFEMRSRINFLEKEVRKFSETS